jgi:hypothetical protein
MQLRLHRKQGEAFLSKATEILYGGAAGGGKSHLFRVAAISWCTAIPGLQVYIFRRTYPDLWKNHMEGPGSFPALLAPWTNTGQAQIIYSSPGQIRFPNGSKIHLCHCQHEKDVYDYQGAEIHVLMIDELTQWPKAMYTYLRGRVRLGGLKVPQPYKDCFPRVLCGANPGGIGHNWVKADFISPAPALQMFTAAKDEGGMRRQFIPARLDDNPTLVENDPNYVDRLSGLGSAELVKAMREGDWNIVAGGALDDVWSKRIEVARFAIPPTWRVDRSFDWGSSHPFSVCWWAEADGTEAKLPSGQAWCPPRGSLILVHEWYGASGPNKGLKLGPRKIAAGILEREKKLIEGSWVAKKPAPGPADNQISAVSNPDTPTIADEMKAEGIVWTESDKAPGTRTIGLELLRARLEEAGKDHPEDPALFIMEHCRSAIAQLPVLPRDPRDPDDVDTAAEDHIYDAVRYRVLAAKRRGPIVVAPSVLNRTMAVRRR